MRKVTCMLLSLMMLLTMVFPVMAEDTVISQENNTIQETGEAYQPPAAEAPPATQPHVHSWTLSSDSASCTADGTKTYVCECSETMTEASPATGHAYGAGTALDDTYHEQTCSSCGAKVASTHALDAGTVTKEATCKDTGTKTYSCTGCSYTKTETIPVSSNHSYDAWLDDEVSDSHFRTCKVCKKIESGSHNWGSGTVINKPTCKETGKKEYTCTGCDGVLEETLAMLTTHTYDSACDKECNVCGKTRETSHTFTVVWSKNYEGHWHECTKCGKKEDYAKHIAGPAATEAKDQVCLTCSYVITPKKEHKHSYESKWTSDEVGHWYACKTCDSEKDYAAHTFDNACDPDCNVCSYKKETAHTYNDPWQTTEKEHWNTCSVCNEETKHEKHIPGDEASDEAAQLCAVCGYEIAPKLEHTHDFGNAWIQAQDNHWQECKCGELSVPEAHVWNEGKKNRDDTVTYTCTFCGMERTEEASGGFPWIMVILGLLALICAGGIVAIVIILKRGGFDESEELEEDPEEPPMEEMDDADDMDLWHDILSEKK